MNPFFTLLVSLCGLALLGAGCPSPKEPSTPPVTASSLDWSHVVTASVTASNGIVIKSCGGTGPIVCAFKENKPVGQMELLTYDLVEGGPVIDQRIQDFYQNIGIDRKKSCPTGFSIATTTPEPAQVAGGKGTKARLEVRDTTNKLVERYTLYMTEQTNKLYIFNISGYEKGSCVSEEVEYTTIQNLDSGAEEAFEAVVRTSILPL